MDSYKEIVQLFDNNCIEIERKIKIYFTISTVKK